MIGNNPSYIVARQLLDYKTSWELMEELTSIYVSEQSKYPTSNLEIEVKTGYNIVGRDQVTDSLKNLLFTQSHRDFLIVGLRSQKATLPSYFGIRDLIGETYHLVKEKISKKRFLDVKNFFDKENILLPGKVKESRVEFSVDFAMADGSRVTYDLLEKSWKRIKKVDKTTLDILHRSFPYRISYAFEEKLEFEEGEFIKTPVRNIRIKDRTSYSLEYMEYSLTEVVQYDQVGNNLDEMKILFWKSEKKNEETLERFAEMKLRMEEDHEIEVEIIDKEPFKRALGKPDFASFLKRFLRNAEGLFLIPKLFQETLSMDFCNNNMVMLPRIGQYFSEIYLEKIKETSKK